MGKWMQVGFMVILLVVFFQPNHLLASADGSEALQPEAVPVRPVQIMTTGVARSRAAARIPQSGEFAEEMGFLHQPSVVSGVVDQAEIRDEVEPFSRRLSLRVRAVLGSIALTLVMILVVIWLSSRD